MRVVPPGKGGGSLKQKEIQRPVHKGEHTLALPHGGSQPRQPIEQRDLDLGKREICLKDLTVAKQ